MLTLIYPYRNRELARIQKSLTSLKNQTVNTFTVRFVDYGSEPETATKVAALLAEFDFATYVYYPTHFQPWNKCKALNSVIKNITGGFCFVADVDMIFHSEFIERAISLQKPNTATFFQVGFLTEAETKAEKDFAEYRISFTSTEEATGLTMFPTEALQSIKGFDEFYHFWGAEDTDMHVRLQNAGCTVTFYDAEVLMLHQWHQSYRNKETSEVTKNLQVSEIVAVNHQHLQYAISNKSTTVNPDNWGTPLTETVFQKLQKQTEKPIVVANTKAAILHFLYSELSEVTEKPICFQITADTFQNSLKYKAKSILGKKVPSYFTLKEINDMLLLHIISFYRNYHYTYQVFEAENTLQLTIAKPIDVKKEHL